MINRTSATKIAKRPYFWQKETSLPIFIFIGDEASSWTERFLGSVRQKVPYAEIKDEPESIAELINRIAGESGDLGDKVPRSFLPAPRFPLTQTILWALNRASEISSSDNKGAGNSTQVQSERDKDAAFEAPLKEWLGKRTAWRSRSAKFEYTLRFLWTSIPGTSLLATTSTNLISTIGLINLWIVALSGAIAYLIAIPIAHEWSSGSFRYRWLREQPHVKQDTWKGLASYMRYVSDAAYTNPKSVERLLVHALLEDLRIAYKRRLLWPGWGRSGYAIVTLHHLKYGTPGLTFINTLHDIVAEYGVKAPLLTVVKSSDASIDFDSHVHVSPMHATSFSEIGSEYQKWCSRYKHATSCPYLIVRATSISTTRSRDGRARKRRHIPIWPALVHWLLVTLVLLGPLTWAGSVVLRRCEAPLISQANQCIGVSSTIKSFHSSLQPVMKEIVQQNESIISSELAFRIIYFGPLTLEQDTVDQAQQLVGTAAELAGLLARQKVYNSQKKPTKMIIEFANTGQDYTFAEMAAGAVVQRAEGDNSVAAVVGLGWSKINVRRSIGIFQREQIASVSPTATAVDVAVIDGKRSPYFFRLSPSNYSEALVTAQWLKQTGLPSKNRTPIRSPKVGILSQKDDGELYSSDLANQFARAYMSGRHSMYTYTTAEELRDAIITACKNKEQVLYFTGRADGLQILRDSWGSHCSKDGVLLLAGDDVMNAVSASPGTYPDLHFVALTNPLFDDLPEASGHHWRTVNSIIREMENEKVGQIDPKQPVRLSSDHARLAYDAALVITEAFDRFKNQGGGAYIRSGVIYNLRGLKVDGATGTVQFSEDAVEHDALNRPLWLMSVEGDRMKPHMMCRPTQGSANCVPVGANDLTTTS